MVKVPQQSTHMHIYIYIYVCIGLLTPMYKKNLLWVVTCVYMCVCIYINIYTGCPRRNVPDFGRVFLMLKYTDTTQNTYVQI